ncbi:hypothetical protein GCM10029978_099940 [Actinoallomurus acanthiterrae]
MTHPAVSEVNLTPSSTEFGSSTSVTCGIALSAQIEHGHVPGVGCRAVVNDQVYAAVIVLPAMSLAPVTFTVYAVFQARAPAAGRSRSWSRSRTSRSPSRTG